MTLPMPTFDASSAQVRIFTDKEGLLSAVAHDLELDVRTFRIDLADDSLRATFDPASLRVLHALKDGHPTTALGAKDKADIEASVQKEVLATRRFPTIELASTALHRDGPRATVTAQLTLHGTTRSVTFSAIESSGQWVAEVPLHQPDFGIKPYSALFGALKVKPGIRVRATLRTA
jgi:polyisoprenoid-binding protein YceI